MIITIKSYQTINIKSKHQNNYKLMQNSRQNQNVATVSAETNQSETFYWTLFRATDRIGK